MTSRLANGDDRELIAAAVARLRAGIMALVFGAAGGLGLFVATLWLLVRGGHNVGQHLSLLGNYFPGYEVSPLGTVLGLLYGGVTGAAIGWCLALVYNRVATLRGG